MTYNIYTKALQILKDREECQGKVADKAESYTTKMSALSAASAYHNAWWILYYAIHEDWEALDQYDYYSEEQE